MSGLRNANNGNALKPYGQKSKKIGGIAPGTNNGEVVVYEQLQEAIGTTIEANNNDFTGNNTHSGTETFTNAAGVTTDVITENTAAAGVTVDGLLIKDGGITSIIPNVYKGATTITAFATGGQGSATALTSEYNEITVCATAGDSVSIGTPALGTVKWVRNMGANAADVFGSTGVTIDGGSANAAVRIQPGQTMAFKGLSATAWVSNNQASGTVAQGTNITTGVTLNAVKGLITTQAATAGAGGATPNTFTLTNSFIQADSHVAVYIMDYSGTFATNGNPFVVADARADGSVAIVISNAHASNALNGTLVIGFEVKN